MRLSVPAQIVVLLSLALILGIANNFRPKAQIEWLRDWPDYAAVAPKAETADQAQPGTSDAATTSDEADQGQSEPSDVSPAAALAEGDPGEVADFVTANSGITDIGIERAAQIYRHAADFTFWIDARSPELFEKGHIDNAHLLYLYEKHDYMDAILAEIEASQPVALVVYCKGKECTDSHHLAQDLEANGFANIFVYKDGYDDWYKAGLPVTGTDVSVTANTETAETDTNEGSVEGDPSEVADFVTSHVGISDIDLLRARQIYEFAGDFTLWIDARSGELFDKGHIKGAQLLHLYEKHDYMPQVMAVIEEKQPVALVVYCKGKECTDSHHLAEDLQAQGYENIFVYKDGFDDWYKAGYPIVGTLAEAPATGEGGTATGEGGTATAQAERPPLETEKPPGMYLEHVVRDMVPFVLGLLLLVFWKPSRQSPAALWGSCLMVGAFFIWAAYPKIANPFLFAKDIWNYDLAPAFMINISALWLPMIELLAALAVMTGILRRGGGLVISGLLVIFIVAVSANVLRGHEFNCGCTSTATMFTDTYLPGWNDKYTLILRDIGLLAMSWLAFRARDVEPARAVEAESLAA
ncbi:Methylamine utilization protein MauE [Sulfidibacter corallicola]|uniref:Rhodanese domain-containing protein n=1 Tax=Sulfidibacter corallicola TaxID=2818388 RepID=A0A8A4TST6_SULCO|nr:rhodanese-like domain-containing protein [Sulfidibacter corallicola]QTD52563.1 hypothetical protein J3U87_08825 [Sulfidibacter corallicola]